mmetsp:Transcript_57463/g.159953  ORF Transcript_57463/g.159953 Transcript_57463/m.159953 type:complete len:209 (+) Transcript_57463:318-944(+)
MRLTITGRSTTRSRSWHAQSGLSLTPSKRTYDTMTMPLRLPSPVIAAAYSSTTSINASILKVLAIGTICSRSSCVGACSDTASLILGSSSISLRMLWMIPTVETVMPLGAKPKRNGSTSPLMAWVTPSKFSSGSPMPMKTTFETGRRDRACTSCSWISPAHKLPWRPMVPVAQNVHPKRHPTCEEMQSVSRWPQRSACRCSGCSASPL